MNISCLECRSVFRVDPAKVPATTVRARCSVCGGVITVTAGTSIEDEFSSNSSATSVARSNAAEKPGMSRAHQGLATAVVDTLAATQNVARTTTPASSIPAVATERRAPVPEPSIIAKPPLRTLEPG